jgi:small subunit ribosomal protein S17e
MQVLEKFKDRFTTDFAENKKILDQLAIVRSKGLKNEMAGYITKFVKKQLDSKAEKEAREAAEIEEETEEETTEETVEETSEESEPKEILVENQSQESS